MLGDILMSLSRLIRSKSKTEGCFFFVSIIYWLSKVKLEPRRLTVYFSVLYVIFFSSILYLSWLMRRLLPSAGSGPGFMFIFDIDCWIMPNFALRRYPVSTLLTVVVLLVSFDVSCFKNAILIYAWPMSLIFSEAFARILIFSN